MKQKFNWALICGDYIEVYDERPDFRPARETLVKDVEVITNSNGTILLSGEEIVYHLLSENRTVKNLDFTPADHEIKCYREGFFRKRYVDYVRRGWIEDKETRKYEAKFSGYAMRFFTSGGIQVQ